MTDRGWSVVAAATGLLCLLILLGDLRRGATRFAGVSHSRERKPALFWSMVLLYGTAGLILLMCAVQLWSRGET